MQQFQDPENLSTNSMTSKSYCQYNNTQYNNQYNQNYEQQYMKQQSRTPQRQSHQPTADKKILGEHKSNYQYMQPDISQNMGLSPENLIQKLERDNGDLMRYSIEEINRELDHNMNETIILLNRRKALIQQKRKRMILSFSERMDQIKTSDHQNLDMQFASSNNQIQQLINSISSVTKINKQIAQIGQINEEGVQEKQKIEQEKSQEFWNSNKYFEDQIDNLLQRLKYYDQELEKNNAHVTEHCKNLDTMEDQIRELLLSKTVDHVQKAEPMYQHKQQIHDALQQQINQRNQIKDEKISLIYSIINNLGNLKDLRQQRLSELISLFGIDENIDSNLKMSYFVEFVDQLENLAKIKDHALSIENSEELLKEELDQIARQNEQMFTDLIRRQSEEARLFGEYSESLRKRENIQKGISYFCAATNLNKISHLDIKDILSKFKENIIFMKPLVEEDQAIKQGLNKTCETIQTFNNMLKQIENEKTKRKELVYILESCSKLKQEEENQTDILRQCEMDITKKQQQKVNLEEDLENILSEADLGQYKKLGIQIQNYENELLQLSQQRMFIQNELDELNKEIYMQMTKIRNEYDEIIRDLLPGSLLNTYDFKKANDIKTIKNYLKKTFKRIGIID